MPLRGWLSLSIGLLEVTIFKLVKILNGQFWRELSFTSRSRKVWGYMVTRGMGEGRSSYFAVRLYVSCSFIINLLLFFELGQIIRMMKFQI